MISRSRGVRGRFPVVALSLLRAPRGGERLKACPGLVSLRHCSVPGGDPWGHGKQSEGKVLQGAGVLLSCMSCLGWLSAGTLHGSQLGGELPGGRGSTGPGEPGLYGYRYCSVRVIKASVIRLCVHKGLICVGLPSGLESFCRLRTSSDPQVLWIFLCFKVRSPSALRTWAQ